MWNWNSCASIVKHHQCRGSSLEMNYFALLCLLIPLFLKLSLAGGEQAETGIEGTSGIIQSNERSVVFMSKYDGILDLYWIGSVDSGEVKPVSILELQKGVRANVNTFDGHIFYASSRENGVRAEPRRVVISSARSEYTFEPELSDLGVSKGISDGDESYENMNRDTDINHGLHPSVTLLNSGTTAMSAKFRSLVPSGVDYYYDDGADGVYQGRLNLGQESTTNTYEGHVFYFTRVGDKSTVLERAVISKDKVLYIVEDQEDPPPQHLRESTERELRFMQEYKERTGIHWRHFYGPDGPRAPPELFMWPAKDIGQVHRVTTEAGYWQSEGCHEGEEAPGRGLFSAFSSPVKKGPCQKPGAVNLTLEVISTAPRAFVIENFLSDYEADKIIQLSKDNLGISTVGNEDGGGARTDATRTSMNTWLGRRSCEEMETLFLRAADVLRVNERLLNREENAEDLQVVHYENGQKYDSHHDWGVSGYPESRFMTLLMYLTDQPDKKAGGETAFPKADNGRGIKVHPGKGSAVLFYNLLEDGNGDDLALHAALPVRPGHEKFLANFWIWTPRRR